MRLMYIETKGEKPRVQIATPEMHILVVDPSSWAYFAALLLTKMSEALGAKLGEVIGEGLGKAILEALGIVKRSDNEDLKRYLDAVADRIVAAVGEQIHANEIRRENSNLKTAWEKFEEYLLARGDSRDKLEGADMLSHATYNQLESFDDRAVLGSLMCTGILRLAVALERYDSAKNKKEAAKAALKIAKLVHDQVQTRISAVQKYFDERIVEPYATTTRVRCIDAIDHDGRPGRVPGHNESLAAVAYRLDGRTILLPIVSCNAGYGGGEPSNADEIRAAYQRDKARLADEYLTKFADPYRLFDQAYNDLLNKLS